MADEFDYDRLAKALAEQSKRDRGREEEVTPQKVEDIVNRVFDSKIKQVVQTAVTDTLISFNLDPAQRTEIVRDFLFIRDMRTLSAESKKHIVIAITVALSSIVLGGIGLYAKASGKF